MKFVRTLGRPTVTSCVTHRQRFSGYTQRIKELRNLMFVFEVRLILIAQDEMCIQGNYTLFGS